MIDNYKITSNIELNIDIIKTNYSNYNSIENRRKYYYKFKLEFIDNNYKLISDKSLNLNNIVDELTFLKYYNLIDWEFVYNQQLNFDKETMFDIPLKNIKCESVIQYRDNILKYYIDKYNINKFIKTSNLIKELDYLRCKSKYLSDGEHFLKLEII